MAELKNALNLVRRLPPSSVENSLTGLLRLAPELTEELLQSVDQPLKMAQDPADGRSFILCDFNRDGDAFRSPWSNTYCHGEGEGEMFPRSDLRRLEIEANAIFDVYRKL
jgi:capping protein beta